MKAARPGATDARRGALAAAVAAAVTGCGGSGPAPGPPQPSPTPPPTDKELISTLLDRRAEALAKGRPARLGVHDARYVIEDSHIGRRRARLRVRLDYEVRGVEGVFGVARMLTARREHGGWRITGMRGRRGADPWDVGDYRRVTTPHFVVWTPKDVPVPEGPLEDGYARMSEVLRRARLRDRYMVVMAADAAQARRITQAIGGLESLTALTDTQVRVSGPAQRVDKIKSQRLILVNSHFGTGSPDEQLMTVTHELTHAALAPQTSGRVPAWLVEGLAEYVSADDRRQEADYYRSVGLAPTLASLSAPDQIGHLGGDLQSAAYAEASAAAYNIALTYGRAKLLELYLLFNDPALKGRRGDPRMVQRAVRQVLGISLEDLQ